MNALTNVHKYILFALGCWYSEANRKIKDKNLEIAISKSLFIDMMMKSCLAGKKERALYKNLEELEKRKLIGYSNRNISLTKKGMREFEKIDNEISPYTNLKNILNSKDPFSYTRRIQTKLKY